MNRPFYPKGLSNKLIELQEYIIRPESIIIILDKDDYKIIQSKLNSTNIVKELENSRVVEAKDNFIVDEDGSSVWISTSEPNDDLYIRNTVAETRLKDFLERNELTKEEVISLLENM